MNQNAKVAEPRLAFKPRYPGTGGYKKGQIPLLWFFIGMLIIALAITAVQLKDVFFPPDVIVFPLFPEAKTPAEIAVAKLVIDFRRIAATEDESFASLFVQPPPDSYESYRSKLIIVSWPTTVRGNYMIADMVVLDEADMDVLDENDTELHVQWVFKSVRGQWKILDAPLQ